MHQVVVCGNLSDGFAVVGLFADALEAVAWMDDCNCDCWMMEPVSAGAMNGSHVVLRGDLSHGYRIVGPFPDEPSAMAWKYDLPAGERLTAWVEPLCSSEDFVE